MKIIKKISEFFSDHYLISSFIDLFCSLIFFVLSERILLHYFPNFTIIDLNSDLAKMCACSVLIGATFVVLFVYFCKFIDLLFLELHNKKK